MTRQMRDLWCHHCVTVAGQRYDTRSSRIKTRVPPVLSWDLEKYLPQFKREKRNASAAELSFTGIWNGLIHACTGNLMGRGMKPPYTTEVKNKWDCTSTLSACRHGVHRVGLICTCLYSRKRIKCCDNVKTVLFSSKHIPWLATKYTLLFPWITFPFSFRIMSAAFHDADMTYLSVQLNAIQ